MTEAVEYIEVVVKTGILADGTAVPVFMNEDGTLDLSMFEVMAQRDSNAYFASALTDIKAERTPEETAKIAEYKRALEAGEQS